jgi:hypothetical protein
MRANFGGRIAASLLSIACAVVFAQGTTPNSSQPDQSPKTSGMGPHHKPGAHHNDHGCCGPSDTTGWSMMDKKERSEHREKMRTMATYEDCKSYADAHHSKMLARAAEKTRNAPPTPRRDACAWLKK